MLRVPVHFQSAREAFYLKTQGTERKCKEPQKEGTKCQHLVNISSVLFRPTLGPKVAQSRLKLRKVALSHTKSPWITHRTLKSHSVHYHNEQFVHQFHYDTLVRSSNGYFCKVASRHTYNTRLTSKLSYCIRFS